MAAVDFFEAEDRVALPAAEALRDEEGPDDFEAFGSLDDGEILVDELSISAVFPVEFDLDNDSDSLGGIQEDGIGLAKSARRGAVIPRLDE